MAPEQLKQVAIDNPFKSEVFQMGVVLFRLVFKTYPFQKTSLEATWSPNFIEEFIKSP